MSALGGVRGTMWALMVTGRVIAIGGLALLYLSFALYGLAGIFLPWRVWTGALIAAAAGCLWLASMFAWPARRGGVTIERAVGVSSLLPALVLAILQFFVGPFVGVSWLIASVVLLVGSTALYLLSRRRIRANVGWPWS